MTDMQLGDIDRNSDLDVVVPDGSGTTNVIWLENPRPSGDPKSGNWIRHTIGSHGTWAHDVEVADFNRDGFPDLQIALELSEIAWYRHNGSSQIFLLPSKRLPEAHTMPGWEISAMMGMLISLVPTTRAIHRYTCGRIT